MRIVARLRFGAVCASPGGAAIVRTHDLIVTDVAFQRGFRDRQIILPRQSPQGAGHDGPVNIGKQGRPSWGPDPATKTRFYNWKKKRKKPNRMGEVKKVKERKWRNFR